MGLKYGSVLPPSRRKSSATPKPSEFQNNGTWKKCYQNGWSKPENRSVFVDKAVNQIITATESAIGEKPNCKDAMG